MMGLLDKVREARRSGSGAAGVPSREDGREGVADSCRRWLLESTKRTGGGRCTFNTNTDAIRI